MMINSLNGDFNISYDVNHITNDDAFLILKKSRWGSGETVICPSCDTAGKHYYKRSRKQWQCKTCLHTFSVTSGTSLACRKLSYIDCVKLLLLIKKGYGVNYMELSRLLDVQYVTAYRQGKKQGL